IRGEVIPFTYVTEHSPETYKQIALDNSSTYSSGLEVLLIEIVNYINDHAVEIGLDLTDPMWDQYKNNESGADTFQADGILDMLITHYRHMNIENIADFPGSAFAGLNAINQYGIHPLNNNIPLGSMLVTAHSGVISNGYKLKPSVNTTAHVTISNSDLF